MRGSPEEIKRFHEERASGLGATDAAAVLGVSPFSTAFQVWQEKTGRIVPEDISEVPAVKWGTLLESVVAAEFFREAGRTHVAGRRFRRHPDYPFLVCHLDRLQEDPEGKKPGRGILEVKTTNAFLADAWEEEIPLHYQIQIQHQFAVTGAKWGSVAVLIGGQDFRWMDVEPNPRFIANLESRLTEFWERYVLGDVAPELTAADLDAVRRQFSNPEEREIAFPREASAWDERLEEIKRMVKELEAEKDLLSARIIASLGGAQVGKLPGGGRYTYRKQTRETFKATAEVKAAHPECLSVSEFCVLRRGK